LQGYDLIILTGFAPNVSYSGINNIKSSGKPVMVINYWDCEYAYKLNLTDYDGCEWFGDNHIGPADEDDVRSFYGTVGLDDIPITPLDIYTTSYTQYGIGTYDLADDMVPLFYIGDNSFSVAAAYDPTQNYMVTGLYDTSRYTQAAWMLFDLMLIKLQPVNPAWQTVDEAWDDYLQSDLKVFVDELKQDQSVYSNDAIVDELWRGLLYYNGPTPYGLPDIMLAYIWMDLPWATIMRWHQATASLRRPSTEAAANVIRAGVICERVGADCEDERWLLGQNYWKEAGMIEWDVGSRYSTPITDGNIMGTDLGLSVSLNSNIFFYFGDTWGCGSLNHCFTQDIVNTPYSLPSCEEDPEPFPSLPVCYMQDPNDCSPGDQACMHYKSKQPCDDAMVVASRPDGVNIQANWQGELDDLFIVMPQTSLTEGSEEVGFNPLVIDGVNERGTIDLQGTNYADLKAYADGEMGVFNTPTGIGKMSVAGVETIVLWYAAAGQFSGSQSSTAHSWLACSIDGSNFYRCPGWENKYFSEHEYINVSPVGITLSEIDGYCSSGRQLYCNLKAKLGGSAIDGMLLIASSEPYRCGKLYLGFMYYNQGELKVLYSIGNSAWSSDEDNAAPVVDHQGSCQEIPVGIFTAPWFPNSPESVFGEISATRVTIDNVEYLMLLSNHNSFFDVDNNNGPCLAIEQSTGKIILGDVDNCVVSTPIQIRLAKLDAPHLWSAPVASTGIGYGPYIIDDFNQVNAEGEILIAHVLSAWMGGKTLENNWISSTSTCWGGYPEADPFSERMGEYQDEPYGVFVRQLQMRNDGLPPRLSDFEIPTGN
jgi:hypothetical protein